MRIVISPPLPPSDDDTPLAIFPSPAPYGLGAWPSSCSDGTLEAPTGRRSCFLRERAGTFVQLKTRRSSSSIWMRSGRAAKTTTLSGKLAVPAAVVCTPPRKNIDERIYLQTQGPTGFPPPILATSNQSLKTLISRSTCFSLVKPKAAISEHFVRGILKGLETNDASLRFYPYRPRVSSSSSACEPRQMPWLRTSLCPASKPAESPPKRLPFLLVCCSLSPTFDECDMYVVMGGRVILLA